MSKIQIASDAPSGMPLHSHLEKIVDFLLLNGNKLAHNYRWGSNREGYFCHLTEPIDFSRLETTFEFPSTIILGKTTNVIYCERTGCTIKTI